MTVKDSLHAQTKLGHSVHSGLIDDVTKDFKEFWELPIKQSGVEYHKSSYDSVNASLIFDRLVEDSEKDDLALVCPEDPTTTLLVIIESLTSLLKYDMLSSTSQVLSTIKPNDPVGLMQNRKMLPGIYMGIEEVHGCNLHCVKTEDGMITKIPPNRSKWRIQPYMSSDLSGRKRSTLVFGKVLEGLIGLPPGGLMAFQHSKALLVTPEKARITEAIRGVTLGGDPIETIFPIADYIDVDNRHYIGGNALQREPILGLVSNIDTAVDIALADPAVKLVIVDGASKVRTGYGSISRLNSDVLPRKIICLLKPIDEEEVNTLVAMNIDAWIWKRNDFRALMGERYVQNSGTQPFEIHNSIIKNLAGSEPQTIRVDAYKQLDKAVRSAMNQIQIISSKTPPNEEAGFLFRWGVSLINSLLQLPTNMRDYESYVNSLGADSGLEMDKKINAYKEKLRNSYGFTIPSINTEDCEKLIKNIQDIYSLLSLRNPKAEVLTKFLEENKDRRVTIACCRSEYAGALRKAHIFNKRIKVIPLSEAGSFPDENLVVTGWINRRLAAKLFLAPYKNIAYLLYEREAQSYYQTLRSHPSSPISSTDTVLRSIMGLKTRGEITNSQGTETDSENDIEALIKTVNEKYGGPNYTEQLHQYGGADMVPARQLIFEDDSYAYLTETQNIDKLERSSSTTRKSKLADMLPGDELIFAESGRDMFEDLLAIIRETEEYQVLFEKARLWHRALESYMEDNNLDEEKLATHLALVGSRPNIVTIRMWVKGAVISPAKDYLHAIARVTGNSELNDKLDEVAEACTKLYALHIQTGRLLVRRIIKAAAQEDEGMLNDEAKEKIDSYSQSARVVTIREISSDVTEVPLKAIGKLFEAGL
jgi:DNA-binding NarL/FixJ family response regulator